MNLKQLAELLELSQTTVSRALNGYPEVSEDTRERVMRAAEKTGYRPNRAAQRLATGKAASIGLVMPVGASVGADPHFSEFLAGLGDEAVRHDFYFVIAPVHEEDEATALKRLAASGNVDAIFAAYIRDNDPRIAMLKSGTLPYLVHGRLLGDTHDYSYLDIDNEGACRTATNMLLQLGHTKFALLNGPADLTFAMRRKLGVEKTLKKAGLAVDPTYIENSEMTDREGFRGMTRILELPERPTAVLCSSTVLALGAVRAINKAGLTLGKDISLIAHDDALAVLRPDNFSVPLTTTRSSLRAAGARIAQRLIKKVNGEGDPSHQEVWETELILRASTGPAPK